MTAQFYRAYQNVSSNLRQRLQNRWGLAEYRRKSRHIRLILVTFGLLIALDVLFPPFRAALNLGFWAIIIIIAAWGAHFAIIWVIAALQGENQAETERGRDAIVGREILAGWERHPVRSARRRATVGARRPTEP